MRPTSEDKHNRLQHSVSQLVQSLSRVWLFATLWIATRQASLSITNSQRLLKLMPIKSVMPSSHLILCHSLLLLPPIPPSIRVFSNESTLRMRWPKYWSFSFSISPSNEHLGLISFRMDWLDRLAVQRTLKRLLEHHSSKASLVMEKSSLNRQYSSINILESSTCYHYLQFRRGNIPRGQYLTKNKKAIKKEKLFTNSPRHVFFTNM